MELDTKSLIDQLQQDNCHSISSRTVNSFAILAMNIGLSSIF